MTSDMIKLLSDFFLQFIFYILQMTQTQKIITHRVSKIHKWIHGDVYIRRESFLRNDKSHIKLLSQFFPIYI